jgi:DNA-binding transcriptional LysR family regulator
VPPVGGGDRKVLDRVFAKHNLVDRVRPAVISGLVDVTRQYVTMGLGVGVMYVTAAVVDGMPGLQLRPLDVEVERLPIEMAVRRGAHLPEYVEAFRRAVRDHLAARPAAAGH